MRNQTSVLALLIPLLIAGCGQSFQKSSREGESMVGRLGKPGGSTSSVSSTSSSNLLGTLLYSCGAAGNVKAMDLDAGGNIVMAGTCTSSSAPASEMLKMDSSGKVLWEIDFPSGMAATSLKIDHAGNAVVVGSLMSEARVYKVDARGSLVWEQRFSDAAQRLSIHAVSVDENDAIYLSGEGSVTSSSYHWKLDSNGKVLWANAIAQKASGSGQCGQVVTSDSVYSSCSFELLKMNRTTGAEIWRRTQNDGAGFQLALDGQGNVAVLNRGFDGATNAYFSFLRKYDPAGNLVGKIALQGTSSFIPKAFALDGSGNIYVTGQQDIVGRNGRILETDLFTGKFSSNGAVEWRNSVGGKGYDMGGSIVFGKDAVYVGAAYYYLTDKMACLKYAK